MTLLWIVLFTLLGGATSAAAAGTLLLLPDRLRERLLPSLVSYAVGAMLAAAFLGLLPEACRGHQAGAPLGRAVHAGAKPAALDDRRPGRPSRDRDGSCETGSRDDAYWPSTASRIFPIVRPMISARRRARSERARRSRPRPRAGFGHAPSSASATCGSARRSTCSSSPATTPPSTAGRSASCGASWVPSTVPSPPGGRPPSPRWRSSMPTTRSGNGSGSQAPSWRPSSPGGGNAWPAPPPPWSCRPTGCVHRLRATAEPPSRSPSRPGSPPPCAASPGAKARRCS